MAGPASRKTDACKHPNLVLTGSPDTVIGGKAAARVKDRVRPCPKCSISPGIIVEGAPSTFVNSKPLSRIGDDVRCGKKLPPPPGGVHVPTTLYVVKPEDNYVAAVFSDDAALIEEASAAYDPLPEPDLPLVNKPLSFLAGLSLTLNLTPASAEASKHARNKMAVGFGPVFVGDLCASGGKATPPQHKAPASPLRFKPPGAGAEGPEEK